METQIIIAVENVKHFVLFSFSALFVPFGFFFFSSPVVFTLVLCVLCLSRACVYKHSAITSKRTAGPSW